MNQKAPARRLDEIAAAANYLRCSKDTVRRMIAGGELTGYRIGKRMLRVDMNEVESLAQRVPTAGDAA